MRILSLAVTFATAAALWRKAESRGGVDDPEDSDSPLRVNTDGRLGTQGGRVAGVRV
jgi:hypothetical protein